MPRSIRYFSRRSLKARLAFVLAVIGYIAIFDWTYRVLVSPHYAYFGLDYRDSSLSYRIATWVLAIVPAVWLPLNIKRPSIVLFLTQYFAVYIPGALILHSLNKPQIDELPALQIIGIMLLGLSIMQAFYYIRPFRVRYRSVGAGVLWTVLIGLSAIPLGYLLLSLGGSFSFTSFGNDNVVFRLEQAANMPGGGLLRILDTYGQLTMVNTILPVIAAIGLLCKRKWFLIPVSISYIVVFGLTAFRSHLLAPVFILGMFLWVKKGASYVWLLVCLCISLIVPLAVPESLGDVWLAMWNVRTLAIPGLAVGQYYEFSRNNPLTYFSHLNIVGLFVKAPYENIHFAITRYFYGVEFGGNANFWAGDGLAALGLIGIPVMSLVCACLFWMLDSLSQRYRPQFVFVCLAPLAVAYANASLFTLLLSCGMFLLLLLLFVIPGRGMFRMLFLPQYATLRRSRLDRIEVRAVSTEGLATSTVESGSRI